MEISDGAAPRYRKSTHSGAVNENCVEVAITRTEVLVRDSKNPETPALRYTHEEWAAFLLGAGDGEFALPLT